MKTFARKTLSLLALAALATVALSGCGLETEKANQYLAEATSYQENAEAVIERFKAFPAEWEALFNVGSIGPAQVDGARQLIAAREADLNELDKNLGLWEKSLRKINTLSVEGKVKEYVRLKTRAIECWQEYSTMYLLPLLKAYGGMVEVIAAGSSYSEQVTSAQEIANLANESLQQLAECKKADKQADDFFTEQDLGK
jgi:hypothetical protein